MTSKTTLTWDEFLQTAYGAEWRRLAVEHRTEGCDDCLRGECVTGYVRRHVPGARWPRPLTLERLR